MASLGSTVRRAFGPYERQIADLYRSAFINLEDLSACIRDWAQPKQILEIGCGEGALAERLVRDFPDAAYVGIDITPTLGRLYNGPRHRVSFEQVRAEDLAETRQGAFDLILMNDVLHHVEEADRQTILDAASAMLAPGGTMIFKDWVRRPTPIHAAVYVADAYIGGDRKVRYMSLNEQRDRLTRAFGPNAIQSERPIRPWSQNLAFLIKSEGLDANPATHPAA